MFRRLLSLLGLSWYIPTPQAAREGVFAPPDTDGQATISFTPGKKTALSADEAKELQDERRDRITDDDLVWPGKTDTIHIYNDEPLAYRFALSVTDLDPSYYMLRPPVGGVWQPEGGTLLQPGEEASFEVVFLSPSADKVKVRPFQYVLSRFDPRRIDEPGEVLEDVPMRWVSLPANGDLKLTARPEEVVIRPWRRTALFDLQLQNRSALPPSVQLQIVRAPTKKALAEETDPVGTLSQSLEARTLGVWHCLLPPTGTRASYFATATGTAYVADNIQYPLELPKPITVRYVPWLRRGRDWAFLGCALFGLIWLWIGIPIYKGPTVYFTLKNFKPPEGTSWEELQVSVSEIEHRKPAEEILGEPEGPAGSYHFPLPKRWVGYRWPFGWSWLNRKPEQFKVRVSPKDPNKQPKYDMYDLHTLKPEGGYSDHFAFDVTQQSPFDAWTPSIASIVHVKVPPGRPGVQRITPEECSPGALLTIEGEKFGSEPGKVLFDGKSKPVERGKWRDRSITILVPKGMNPGTATVSVQVDVQLPDGTKLTGDSIYIRGEAPPRPPDGTKPSIGTSTSPPAGNPPAGTKPSGGTNKLPGGPSTSPGGTDHPHVANQVATQEQMERWCAILDVPDKVEGFVQEQKRPGALHLTIRAMTALKADDINLVITTDKDCYIQIYESKQVPGRSDRGEPIPLLGQLGDKEQFYFPEADISVRAWLFSASKPRTIPVSAGKASRIMYVVLARSVEAGALENGPLPDDNLLPLLKQQPENLTGWAIVGTAWEKLKK